MSTIVAVLTSLGGIVAFFGALFVIIKAIAKQINTTEANTRALSELNETVKTLDRNYDSLRERVAALEGGRR